jgi:GntR family transcriptional regulator
MQSGSRYPTPEDFAGAFDELPKIQREYMRPRSQDGLPESMPLPASKPPGRAVRKKASGNGSDRKDQQGKGGNGKPRPRHASTQGHDRAEGTAPLYLQVANKLLEEIQRGSFPVGSLLPTEVELSALHGVSRQTVRHAIGQLREKGLVSARKGVGTRVESISAARRFNYSAQSVGDLFTLASETEMTVQKRTMIVARGSLAAQLGCRSGHRWLHLACLRTIIDESRPLSWTDIFVDGRLAPILRKHERFRSAVFALIEREAGETVVEIQQEIRAILLDDANAERLQAERRSPALQITRRYFSTGRRLIQVSVNTIPSDRFFYSVEILSETKAP